MHDNTPLYSRAYVHKRRIMFTNVFFNPVAGKNYATKESLFSKKILVLGDSHYCDCECTSRETCGDKLLHPDCLNFTEEIINMYLNPECNGTRFSWKRSYSRFINSMYGHSANQEERESFFDSIVFYNFLQNAAGKNWNDANNYDHGQNQHLKAFYVVLDNYMPDVVISWGNRLWNTLRNDWGYGEAEKKPLTINNEEFHSRYYYPYKNKIIMLIGATHPSSSKFGNTFYHELFKHLELY